MSDLQQNSNIVPKSSKSLTHLFIHPISQRITKDEVMRAFSPYGRVKSLSLII